MVLHHCIPGPQHPHDQLLIINSCIHYMHYACFSVMCNSRILPYIYLCTMISYQGFNNFTTAFFTCHVKWCPTLIISANKIR